MENQSKMERTVVFEKSLTALVKCETMVYQGFLKIAIAQKGVYSSSYVSKYYR